MYNVYCDNTIEIRIIEWYFVTPVEKNETYL